MKIKTIKFHNKSELTSDKMHEVKGMIIVLALFASGMIIGAGVVRNCNSDIMTEFSSLFSTYTQSRSIQKIYVTFFNSIIINIIFLFTAFCSGVCCIGLPVPVFLVVIRGLGSGIVAGYLYTEYSINGIGYYLLTIFPGAVVSVTSMLLACNYSCFMSADVLATILTKKQPDAKILPDYLKKYLILLIITIAASVVDCVSTKAFSYLFSI